VTQMSGQSHNGAIPAFVCMSGATAVDLSVVSPFIVMTRLVRVIHVFLSFRVAKTWMARIKRAMTVWLVLGTSLLQSKAGLPDSRGASPAKTKVDDVVAGKRP